MSFQDLRLAVAVEQNVDMKNPGKIYFKDNYIFVVDELKGIHVFDNTNPAEPVKKGFMKIPGVVDISVSGHIMYADSFVDLVVLDVEDINNIHEVGRVVNILPYTVPPVDNDYPKGSVDQDKGVVINWEVKKIKERVDEPAYPPYITFLDRVTFSSEINAAGASSGVSGSGVGVGGSMARFGIKDNVLYVVDRSTLKIFDITSKTKPLKYSEINPGWNVETMFLAGNTMFLGTTTGMVTYDITLPLLPQSRTTFSHARSCDPVIVDDTLAYITLRTGTNCGGVQNSLTVINIKNLKTPSVIATYAMTNPHGLGKHDDLLFICDGAAGLKIFDASDPKTITGHLIFTYPDINSYDVIPVGNILIMIGDDGLYQYDYSNIQSIRLLSSIVIKNK